MKEKVIDFGNEKVSILFKKLFFPTLLGMLSMSAVTTIDGIFVGHGVGSDGIAAVNICVPLLMSLMGAGLMMGAGCSVIASIYLSKGKTVLARATITQAMLFVTLISVTVGGFILAFPEETAVCLARRSICCRWLSIIWSGFPRLCCSSCGLPLPCLPCGWMVLRNLPCGAVS